jgi:hypothetical protein
MSERRLERQRQQRRLLLERAMERVLLEGPDAVDRLEEVCFPEHCETVELLEEMLGRVGLLETCLALARHMEEEKDHWLRRLAFIDSQPRLRLRRQELDQDQLALFREHFERFGATGPAGERSSAVEAACLLAALREAERQWMAGSGRPALPVLVYEALAVVWPALYPHVRRHAR